MSKEKKEEAVVTAVAEVAETVKVNVVYVGPSIPGVVRFGTVFKDGVYTAKINDCISDFPAMQKLFVPVDDMPAAIKEKNKNQSALRSISDMVLAKFNK